MSRKQLLGLVDKGYVQGLIKAILRGVLQGIIAEAMDLSNKNVAIFFSVTVAKEVLIFMRVEETKDRIKKQKEIE